MKSLVLSCRLSCKQHKMCRMLQHANFSFNSHHFNGNLIPFTKLQQKSQKQKIYNWFIGAWQP